MPNFFQFKNLQESVAELSIYDTVGFYGNTAKDFYTALKSVGDKPLNVRINSPGGSVVDGYAIYNLLRAHPGEVTAYIDGIAASIASVIAMAADKVVMPKNALMMIHNPSTVIGGDAAEMRKVADDLDKIKQGIVAAYTDRTKMTAAKVSKMMDEETLLTAQEAVEMGFADEIAAPTKVQNCFEGELGQKVSGLLSCQLTATASAAGGSNNTDSKNQTMTPEQIKAIQDQVTTLTNQKAQLEKDHVSAIEATANKARQDVNDAEKSRRTKIQEIANKYNKDGDLNAATIVALATDVQPDAFKDTVLEAVNARPTKAAIKVEAPKATTETATTEDEKYAAFQKSYAEATDTASRLKLVRNNKGFARRISRETGEASE